MDFWSRFDYSGDDEWPEFTQLAIPADQTRPDQLRQAVETVARLGNMDVQDVTTSPERWESAIVLARNGSAWCVCEPGVELEDRFLDGETAEQIAGLLASDGVFFGHILATGTVHATTFSTGGRELAWFDSALPGPSFARLFHRDGRCSEEDPRAYALDALDMPATSPLLDRYAFVASLLEPFGIESLSPNLEPFEVEMALLVTA